MALSCKFAGRVACAVLVGSLIWPVGGRPAAAQQVSADQLIGALAPPPVTRGLNASDKPGMSDANRAFINSLRHRTRSLSLDESDHVADIGKDRPKTDVEIYFDYNSAAITPKAEPQLNELGKALLSQQLAGSVFTVGGHTDAKGSDEYNQRLSERRALAVKKYLIAKFNVPAENLIAAGYGKRRLKNPADPFGAENRRVEVVNLESAEEAKR
jgi:outer membrane protein OmpA-like peptidoglycan-associated protein